MNRRSLAAHLARHGFELGSAPLRRLGGGLANLNYLVEVNGAPMVLRCAPAGELPPGAHDRAREHAVLSRLPDAFPLAPRSFHLCEDRSVIGVPFQLLEYRDGRVIQGDDLSPLATPGEAGPKLAAIMLALLTDLHAVDADAVGLSDLGKPAGFVARAAVGWTKRGRQAARGRAQTALVQAIGSWLDQRVGAAPGNSPTLLHCDFKLDNILLAHDAVKPVALLDWDMCTRGEPLFDVATLLSYWTEEDDPECMHRLAQMPTARHGFPTRAEFLASYGESTGRSLEGFALLRVLCLFKLAVVFLQLHARWLSGAMGQDERYSAFEELGEAIMVFAGDVAAGRAE